MKILQARSDLKNKSARFSGQCAFSTAGSFGQKASRAPESKMEELRGDREVVLAAVESAGCALQFAAKDCEAANLTLRISLEAIFIGNIGGENP